MPPVLNKPPSKRLGQSSLHLCVGVFSLSDKLERSDSGAQIRFVCGEMGKDLEDLKL